MTRTRRAQIGFLVGAGLASAGAWLAWGVGYGLLVAGVLLMTWFLALYDVDGEDQ